ncbi:hypothetical protein [Novosphingobium malaysiense]|uniref:Uncharacterized protein n=1 Tax=Novosphingobium malaysiense TaxID=1348853 RepID=A0A0B1ZN56_9SPHN|nr:hypothetical protein [Novosphingobium malaysiense]KHK90735.1 hypothetical protein LK12_15615 [Novosphingobium malaysiense]
MHFPHIRKLSTEAVKANHELLQVCLAADDAAASGRKPFGLREHDGWRKLADAIEEELILRDEVPNCLQWERS